MKVLGCSVLLILWACCGAEAPAPCGKPENKDKEEAIGPLKNEYQHLDTVQYSCRPGYIKMGRIVYTCNNGVWTKTGRARCTEKSCGHPGDLEFGTFELTKAEEFVFGARVEYKCDDGYQMISRVTYRDCTATGWSNSVPFCEPRKCVQFPAPENGKIIATGTHNIDDEMSAGHVLRFECDSPLARPVPNEVYCTSSGQWSSDSVECREITCPEPTIPHGTITNGKPVFRKDERLEFYCEMGYKYEGRPPECTEEGWNPKPFCKEIECYYQSVVNGEMLPRRDKYKQDDTVDLNCHPGFVALYSRDRKPTCTIDGWVPPLKCESKACDYPEIENGRVSSWNYRYYRDHYFPMTKGREIDYECYKGYATESGYGSGRITCTDEGWTPAPRCHRACAQSYFNNMDMFFQNTLYTEGQTASFRCHSEFFTHEGQEAGTVECLSNGKFSQATCIRMCQLTLIGTIKSYKPKKQFFNVEDAVQYECNDGYHSYQRHIVETSECTTEGWRYKPQCQDGQSTPTAEQNTNPIIDDVEDNLHTCQDTLQQILDSLCTPRPGAGQDSCLKGTPPPAQTTQQETHTTTAVSRDPPEQYMEHIQRVWSSLAEQLRMGFELMAAKLDVIRGCLSPIRVHVQSLSDIPCWHHAPQQTLDDLAGAMNRT